MKIKACYIDGQLVGSSIQDLLSMTVKLLLKNGVSYETIHEKIELAGASLYRRPDGDSSGTIDIGNGWYISRHVSLRSFIMWALQALNYVGMHGVIKITFEAVPYTGQNRDELLVPMQKRLYENVLIELIEVVYSYDKVLGIAK